MDYVRRKIVIFHEIMITAAMILLVTAGIWDLGRKEIPCLLLCGLSVIALFVFWNSSFWTQMYDLTIVIFLGIGGLIMVNRGKIGGGDVWILICFALIWPMNVFWESLTYAVTILSIVSVGIWMMTGDEKLQIPMVPFLVLGYWM